LEVAGLAGLIHPQEYRQHQQRETVTISQSVASLEYAAFEMSRWALFRLFLPVEYRPDGVDTEVTL